MMNRHEDKQHEREEKKNLASRRIHLLAKKYLNIQAAETL